jgi:HD superfamily phosphohydrolase
MVSKTLLNEVKKTDRKKVKMLLNFEENKLLKNEISISEQLRKILNIVDRDYSKYNQNNLDRENSLKNKTECNCIDRDYCQHYYFNIILNDFFKKTQSY